MEAETQSDGRRRRDGELWRRMDGEWRRKQGGMKRWQQGGKMKESEGEGRKREKHDGVWRKAWWEMKRKKKRTNSNPSGIQNLSGIWTGTMWHVAGTISWFLWPGCSAEARSGATDPSQTSSGPALNQFWTSSRPVSSICWGQYTSLHKSVHLLGLVGCFLLLQRIFLKKRDRSKEKTEKTQKERKCAERRELMNMKWLSEMMEGWKKGRSLKRTETFPDRTLSPSHKHTHTLPYLSLGGNSLSNFPHKDSNED